MSQYEYRNVMESLVEQEVSRQLSKLSPQMVSYLRPVEIVTYALNRLPALYACSERGVEQQIKRARQEQGPQIVQAVRWAIMAVQQDPLRKFVPLKSNEQDQILAELRTLLQGETVTWDSLPQAIEQALATETSNPKQGGESFSSHVKSAMTWQDYKKRYRNTRFSNNMYPSNQ